MKCKIITRSGTQTIDTEAGTLRRGTPLFIALRKYFEQWINEQHADIKDQYFGSFEELEGSSYLDPDAAIIEMYLVICQYIEENELSILKSSDFYKIDLDGVLQP